MSRRLPLPERLALRLLLPSGAAEDVVGDIVERYHADLKAVGPVGARRALRRDVAATCVAWWRPDAVRRRARRHGSGDLGIAPAVSLWLHDARLAVRGLIRRPAFSLSVAATLGLGIGATAAIFSVVDGVLIRPLRYQDADRLVAVGTTFPTREWDEDPGQQHLAGMALANHVEHRERSRSFDYLAGIEAGTSILLSDVGDGPELVAAPSVGPDFFEILDIAPALGRTFSPDEYRSGSETSVMVTYGAWQRRFGGDPDAVGERLDKIGSPATIVGVLPRDFEAPEAFFRSTPDFWMPLQPDHDRYADRGRRSLYVLGRLAEGVTVEEAREEGTAIAADLAREFPDGNVYPDGSWFGIGVNGLRAQTVGATGRTLRIFLGAAVLLLLLSALNAATLLLARALDRSRELGVRMALGASRGRVGRLLLAEATVLSLLGGAFGAAIAYGGVGAFLRLAPSSIPRLGDVSVDARVLAVTAAVSLGAGLAAGLLPALRFGGRDPWTRLRGTGRGVAEPGSRLRATFVGGQVAVAVVLLSGAGLLFSSFVHIRSVEPGFDPDGLISLQVPIKRPDAPSGEEAWQGWDLALAELAAVPGVEAVAGTTNPPFQSPSWAPRLLLPGEPPDTWREGVVGYAVTPGYFETAGTSLLAGRDLARLDGAESAPVAVVNEAFVDQVLGLPTPGDAVDRTVRQRETESEREIRIVGVVEDVVQTRAEEGRRPAIYVPHTQADWPYVHAVVRTSLPADVAIPELRQAVARFSAIVPSRDLRTMPDRMSATRTTPRFQALLIGAFATLALLLAAAGIYGSLAHAVQRRRRELGVRLALGAERSGVLGLVLRQGMRAAIVGLVVGITATLGTSRVLSGFLFEVEPQDPVTLVGVSVVLVVVAAVACFLPARRATGVDPVEVLHTE